jgi:hypothetical protein
MSISGGFLADSYAKALRLHGRAAMQDFGFDEFMRIEE